MSSPDVPAPDVPAPGADAAARRIESRSAEFHKELGLRDLVLTQILYVVGLSWVGAAAKLGQSQLIFWLAAMLMFYLPQALVVIHLSRRFPLEGGLYQWTKLGFNDGLAFMVAWNLWLYAIVLLGAFGIQVANAIVYALGPNYGWLSNNRVFIYAVSGGMIAALIVVSIIGLGISKWVHNVGAILLLLAFGTLMVLPFVGMARGTIKDYHPFAVAMPALSLMSINIGSKLAVGGLSGFEYVAVLAGETRNPRRTIGLSVMIAAPIIALMFILGTSVILAFTDPSKVDLVGPIPQAFRAGFGTSGAVAFLVPFAVFAVTSRTVANSSVIFTATTRFPLVAGWDRLLPPWFTKLHAKHKTPVNSILFVGGCATVFAILGNAGVGEQEAFQLLDNAAGIFYGLTYLMLFAIPLFGFRSTAGDRKASLGLRIAAFAGLVTTILYVVLCVFPIVDVVSTFAFAAKMGTLCIVANALGAALYINAQRKRASATADAS
ncbi:MAG: APC family permease [Gemmatimonadota bacterium]|nr:APC family permease [Gemmatimonadota bacterium]